ncbi:MAG: RNase H-like domain-containing protein, partial [bacterium]
MKPQESKVKTIKEFPVPITAKQVRSCVSLAPFYRRFITDGANIAKPMHDVAKLEPFEWTDKAQGAFEALKEAMCSDTVLRMPRQGEVFQLYTDASHIAIG